MLFTNENLQHINYLDRKNTRFNVQCSCTIYFHDHGLVTLYVKISNYNFVKDAVIQLSATGKVAHIVHFFMVPFLPPGGEVLFNI